MAKKRSSAGGALAAVAKAAGAVVSPLNAVTGLLNRLGGVVNGFSRPFASLNALSANLGSGLSSSLASVNTPLTTMGPLLNGVADGFTRMANAGQGYMARINALVEANNPGVVIRFNLVLRDLQGTIGEFLIPIVEKAAQIMRKFADGLATMKPAFDKLISAITSVMDSLAGGMVPALQILTPLVQVVAEALNAVRPLMDVFNEIGAITAQVLVPVFNLLGWVFRMMGEGLRALKPVFDAVISGIQKVANAFINALNWIISRVNKILPKRFEIRRLDTFDSLRPRSSMGKGVQPASYTDIEELGRRSSMAAFTGGNSITPDAKAVVDAIGELKKIFEKRQTESGKFIASGLGKMADYLQPFVTEKGA